MHMHIIIAITKITDMFFSQKSKIYAFIIRYRKKNVNRFAIFFAVPGLVQSPNAARSLFFHFYTVILTNQRNRFIMYKKNTMYAELGRNFVQ